MAVDLKLPQRLTSDLDYLANIPAIRFRRLEAERQEAIANALGFIVDLVESDSTSGYFRIPVSRNEHLQSLLTHELLLLRTLVHMRCPWIQIGLCYGDSADYIHTVTVQFA